MDKDAILKLFAHHVSAFDALTNVLGTLLLATPIPAVEKEAAQLVLTDAHAYVDHAAEVLNAATAAAAPAEDPAPELDPAAAQAEAERIAAKRAAKAAAAAAAQQQAPQTGV